MKKIVSVLLIAAMVLSLAPITLAADDTVALDLANGSVVIAQNGDSYTYTQGGSVITGSNVCVIRQTDSTNTSTANTITVSSGTVDMTIMSINIVSATSETRCIDVQPGAVLTLTLVGSSTLTASGYLSSAIYVPDGAALTIDGAGSLSATSGDRSAGIGSTQLENSGTITINGGTVTAAGGQLSAGIGGGLGSSGGTITISGGTVTATGGFRGAGIGGGDVGNGGTITISGGTVTATGGECAAGIGGGIAGIGGTITISGGTVTATGGEYAAGIGGGLGSSGGTVSITGTAYVTATGNTRCPAIGGGGTNLGCDSVTIGEDVTLVLSTTGTYQIIETIFNLTLSDQTALEGNLPALETDACGASGLTYQWQTSSDGTSWTNYPGATGAVSSVPVTAATDGLYVRCKLTNGFGNVVYTDAARVYVLAFTQQPVGKTAAEGASVTLTAESANPGITYHWEKSTDGGVSWDDIAGETSSTLTVTAGTSSDQTLYRCVITAENGDELTSDAVEVTAESSGSVTLDLSNGSVVIAQNGDSYTYTQGGSVITGGDTCIISQTDSSSTTNTITVNSGTVNMTLDEVNIYTDVHPVSVAGGATLNLTLLGSSSAKTEGDGKAGIHVPEGASLTIDGTGSINARSCDNGAGIGGGYGESCGTITINGGAVSASSDGFAAGIGGGYDGSGGNITIAGGTVSAISGMYAAGIGGGYDGSGGNITIAGGTVYASSNVYGAGIGGGHGGIGGTITITGGTVSVHTYNDRNSDCPAGIGSGSSAGYGGSVSITGGEISVRVGSYGVGIGGNGCDVSISGGTIDIDFDFFEAGDEPADFRVGVGIGSSDSGSAGTISITGTAHVSAYGSHHAIGSCTLDNQYGCDAIIIGDDVVLDLAYNHSEGSLFQEKISGLTLGDQSALDGSTPAFQTNAHGASGLTYQWQTSSDGTSWTDYPGATGAVSSVPVTAATDGLYVRCKLTNGFGNTAYTDPARAYVLAFTQQPVGKTAAEGTSVTLTAESANPGITYHWEKSTDGGVSWDDIAGETSSALTVTANASSDQTLYRCVITAENGDELTSDAVEVTAESSGSVTLDLTNGSIIIAQNGDSYTYTQGGNVITGSNVCIIRQTDSTNTSTTNTITVSSGTVDMAIMGINITSDASDTHCIDVQPGVVLNLTLVGSSTLTTSGSYSNAVYVPDGAALTIDGAGSLSAVSGYTSAGIGGTYRKAGGNIIINGGTVTATGGSYAAGIGSGEASGSGGTITINGGTVTATGGSSGAGIGGGARGFGGGDSGSGGTITINGGTVTATGGKYCAGIGGGYGGSGGTITISGGTVTATGSSHGAGIGGGLGGSGGTITISGGSVTATGSTYSAAIGGGYNASGGTITISGGTVTATGGSSGTSIGGGYDGSGGTVSITGTAHVTATTQSSAPAIGGGGTNLGCDSVTIGEDVTLVLSTKGTYQIIETVFNLTLRDQAALEGSLPAFETDACGASGLTYQWQTSPDGETWTDYAGATSAQGNIPLTPEIDGFYVRCQLTNGFGNVVYTDAARVYLLAFTQQPVSLNLNVGDLSNLNVAVTCSNVTYQWERSYDGGLTWTDVPGETFSTLLVSATLSENSALYRCAVTAQNGDCIVSESAEIIIQTDDVTYTIRDYLQNPDCSGYTVIGQTVLVGTAGTPVTAPEYNYDGFTLDTELSTLSGTVTADGTLILTRYYNRNTYSITFDMQGGPAIPALEAVYGTEISAPADPSRYGYTFGGWYADAACTTEYEFTTMPLNGTTVYAKWISGDAGRASDEYRINGILLRDPTTYEVIETAPAGQLLVEVSVTNLSSSHTDTVLIATYDQDGRMLGLRFMYANVPVGCTFTLGASVDNSNGEVAVIRAFVLSSLVGAFPLAPAGVYNVSGNGN